ncbi:MAG TPA: hypothetical protein VK358_02270 [Longimicrobium sp.]|nr:hypothetical protein [Longimicrobium sp.]
MTDGLCILDPVIVNPGECDPWESLDWCSGDCITSVFQPLDQGVQSCPGDGGGAAPGGSGTPPPPSGPGPICPTAETSTCPPVDGEEEEEEEESTICPTNFLGNTQPTLITIAGRNHEFQFHSSLTYPFVLKSSARSPAIYQIGFPTTSKDSWWIARTGTITVFCRGVYISRSRHWVGIVTVLDSDLHMVMGPGHPDF